MKYLKTFESIGDLYDKLKSLGGQGDYKFKGVGNTENGYFNAKIQLTIV